VARRLVAVAGRHAGQRDRSRSSQVRDG
jgi:hypothetical protein